MNNTDLQIGLEIAIFSRKDDFNDIAIYCIF